MKKSTLLLGLGFATVLGLSAFTSAGEKEASKSTSIIEWTGSKVIGGDHKGTISIKESDFEFKKDQLIKGTVVADMTSITNSDLEGEWQQKLIGHLNSDDFFSTSKYPTATIKTTKVTPGKQANTYDIVADLTIKGITKSQSFTAIVKPNGKGHIITANVDIDRTKYEVKYGSSSYFDSLGDKAISDNFNLKVTIYSQN
ncbi:YceI family protein [bacterium SCSIO 12643]|nr:YceI family protein [bacterium SCSIO 12643]